MEDLLGYDFEERLKEAINTERGLATEQALKDMAALEICRGRFTRLSHPELFHYAAVLLREQDRIQHVLDHYETGPLKRELVWAALFPHLLSAGYRLPAPYAPGSVVPTYALASPGDKSWMRPLDLLHCGVLPAVSVQTGQRVALKIVCSRRETVCAEELEIVKALNSPPLRSHPDNLAFQLLDVVPFAPVTGQPRVADYHILVAPGLEGFTIYETPVNGAILPLMTRSFRMLALLHSLGICHRDIGLSNFMFTPDLHELQMIDFGQAQRFDVEHNPTPRVEWIGGSIILPEVRGAAKRPYDPFLADIYCLAYMWKYLCMDDALSSDGKDLFERMCSADPALRPSARECVADLEHCLSRLSFRRMCMPVPLMLISVQNAMDDGRYSSALKHMRRYLHTVIKLAFSRIMSLFRR